MPEWWGLWAARGEEPRIEVLRPTRRNPNPTARGVAGLLWRAEALALATEHGADRGVRSKDRDAIWARLAERVPFDAIHEAAVRSLERRSYVDPAGRDRSRKLRRPATIPESDGRC